MNAQITIVNEVIVKKNNEIAFNNILNEIQFEALPYFNKFQAIININNASIEQPLELQVNVYDPDNNIMIRTAPRTTYCNKELASINLTNSMGFSVYSEGKHRFELCIDGVFLSDCYVMVRYIGGIHE